MGFPNYLDIRAYLSHLGFTCWIWAGKRDTRASIPSLLSMVIPKYVFLCSFHSAAHTAPPHIDLSPFLQSSSFMSSRSYCSIGAAARLFFISSLFASLPQSFGFPKTEVRRLSSSTYFVYCYHHSAVEYATLSLVFWCLLPPRSCLFQVCRAIIGFIAAWLGTLHRNRVLILVVELSAQLILLCTLCRRWVSSGLIKCKMAMREVEVMASRCRRRAVGAQIR